MATVLVVDDDFEWREYARRQFCGEDFDVECVATYGMALKVIEDREFDALVLDSHIDCPDTPGDLKSMVAQLRNRTESTAWTSVVPIIVWTAFVGVDVSAASGEFGLQVFEKGDADESKLYNAIRAAVDESR